MAIGYDVLDLDLEAEAERICQAIRRGVSHDLKRRGVIVALSGGIDSSCVAALCARALGPKHVHGLHMPEKDSSDDTLGLSRSVSDTFGFDSTVEIITPILEGLRCYERRDDAIRMVFPEFGPGWKSKRPASWFQMPTPVMSAGIRSEANWMR